MPFSVFITLFVIMLGLTKLYIWLFSIETPIYAIGAAALTLSAIYLALLPGMNKRAQEEEQRKAEAEKRRRLCLNFANRLRQCRKTTVMIWELMRPLWRPLRRP